MLQLAADYPHISFPLLIIVVWGLQAAVRAYKKYTGF
jgi:hypothetical protein